jgi:hypothetical protein
MPQCPHCQTAYTQGQRYCSTCGSFLLHPEDGDTFCPQCGVRVSPRQEFCHECDAPLKGKALEAVPASATEEPRPTTPAPPPPLAVAAKGLPRWVLGLIGVLGIIVVVLLIVIFSRTGPEPTPPAPAPRVEAPAPAPPVPTPAPAPSPPPAASAADLKEELQLVLSTLREAQLKKNITEFMSVYSTRFSSYDQKRKEALESWQNYDYANLVFTMDKVQVIDPNNALAWVTWYLDVRSHSTQELSSAAQTFQVRFIKEMGHWRIIELKEVQ